MTDTFLCARVGLQPTRSEPEPPSRRGELRKKQRDKMASNSGSLCARQVPPWVVSPKRPNPAHRAHSMVSPKRPEPQHTWHDQNSPRAGWVGGLGFPGLTANPQHTFDPSWSVRLLAAPRSMGPAVFLGSPPTRNPHKFASTHRGRK